MCTVMDLRNGRKILYSCPPEQAVIAAYAQDNDDFNTWEYDEKYGHLLLRGNEIVSCGDFSAFEDGRYF